MAASIRSRVLRSRCVPANQSLEDAARQAAVQLRQSEMSMSSFLQLAVFALLAVIGGSVGLYIGQQNPATGGIIAGGGVVVSLILASAIKVANQWQRAVVLRLGQFTGLRGPGLFFIIPVIDRVRLIDMRVLTHH